MSQQGTIRRYSLILEKIQQSSYPSFDQICDFLFGHGFEVSKRTVQRDIEQIRLEFGLEIKYSRHYNGYFLDEEASLNLESFFRFIELASTASVLSEGLKEFKNTHDFISFDSKGSLKGIEHLMPLTKAIKSRRTVTFIYQNFRTDVQKPISLNPYLLKEYQNRWYVIGTLGDTDEVRTYAIDRMSSVVVTDSTFTPDPSINPASLFENIIGLVYSTADPEEVIISLTPLQAKYAQTLPIHRSQEVISISESEVLIRLNIIPNLEFKHRILMIGDGARVVSPQWLVDEMKQLLKKMLNKYE